LGRLRRVAVELTDDDIAVGVRVNAQLEGEGSEHLTRERGGAGRVEVD
jgi:hypothetical protein